MTRAPRLAVSARQPLLRSSRAPAPLAASHHVMHTRRKRYIHIPSMHVCMHPAWSAMYMHVRSIRCGLPMHVAVCRVRLQHQAGTSTTVAVRRARAAPGQMGARHMHACIACMRSHDMLRALSRCC